MDTIKLLEELVKIDSSTKESANQAIEYSAKYLLDRGIEGKIIENNGHKSYVSVIGNGDKTIILNGHLDVIKADEKMFNPIIKEGRMYGRGTADMKAGCASMINAFIKLSKMDLDCKIMLQLVSDEEDGGLNCSKYLAEQGYLGDFVICGEPTNLGLGIQAKGFMRLDVEVVGKSAHGSRPWEGINAIEKSIEVYEKIKNLDFAKESTSLYEGSSINLALIDGGDVYNKVPDKCKIGLDIRYVPHLNPNEIIEDIKNNIDGNVITKLIGQSVNTSEEDKFVLKLKESTKKITNNNDIRVFGQHGSADTRFFAKENIPAIEFGPSGANWHGDLEYVEISSVYEYEKILVDFILNLNI
ncbi:M20/M25/M40 family metallo-hydrolase [Peptostreptococcaceae bacterium AGR-M142]